MYLLLNRVFYQKQSSSMILKNPGRWGQRLTGCSKPLLHKGVKLSLMVLSAHAAMNTSFLLAAADLTENKVDIMTQGAGGGHDGSKEFPFKVSREKGQEGPGQGRGGQNTSGSIHSVSKNFVIKDEVLKEVIEDGVGSEHVSRCTSFTPCFHYLLDNPLT